MALSDNNRRGQVGPSLRGLIYQYERDGVWVTSKWPKKRGKVATAKQKEAQEAFRAVMRAMKLTAADIQSFHRDASKGTPMLPRDTLMAALYGNGPTMNFYSGKVIKPMANKLLSSTVLDAIGWRRGDILWRGEDAWDVIQKPSRDAILFYDQGTDRPLWIDSDAVGGNGGYWMPNRTGRSSSLQQTRGKLFTMLADRVLTEIFFIMEMDAGAQLKAGVYRVDAAGVITAVLYEADLPDLGDGTARYVKHILAAPIALEDGLNYAVCLRKVSGTGGSSNIICTSGNVWPQLPIHWDSRYVQFGTTTPGVGDAFVVNTSINPSVGIRIK